MATFKQRALNIATRGVISGVAITLATQGLIQVPTAEAPAVAPQEPAFVYPPKLPGGVIRLEGPLFLGDLLEVTSAVRLALDSATEAEFAVRPGTALRSVLGVRLDSATGASATEPDLAEYRSAAALEVAGASDAALRAPDVLDARRSTAVRFDGAALLEAEAGTAPEARHDGRTAEVRLDSDSSVAFLVPDVLGTSSEVRALLDSVTTAALEVPPAASAEHASEARLRVDGFSDVLASHGTRHELDAAGTAALQLLGRASVAVAERGVDHASVAALGASGESIVEVETGAPPEGRDRTVLLLLLAQALDDD